MNKRQKKKAFKKKYGCNPKEMYQNLSLDKIVDELFEKTTQTIGILADAMEKITDDLNESLKEHLGL